MALHGHKPTRRRGIGKFVSSRAKAGTPLKKRTSRVARLRLLKRQ